MITRTLQYAALTMIVAGLIAAAVIIAVLLITSPPFGPIAFVLVFVLGAGYLTARDDAKNGKL